MPLALQKKGIIGDRPANAFFITEGGGIWDGGGTALSRVVGKEPLVEGEVAWLVNMERSCRYSEHRRWMFRRGKVPYQHWERCFLHGPRRGAGGSAEQIPAVGWAGKESPVGESTLRSVWNVPIGQMWFGQALDRAHRFKPARTR